MDCAISAAVTSAAGAAGEQQAGGTSLCDQGKRFAELLEQAPPSAGDPNGMIPLSAIVETYVPAPAALPSGSGGATLMNAIEHVRSLALPSPDVHKSGPATMDIDDLPAVGENPAADLSLVVQQTVAWQTEVIRISMLGDMVSSMNQGVRTLFQQQG